jgi:hypothetical protein
MANRQVMVEAHKNGLKAARDGVTRKDVMAMAFKLPVEEGDFLLAGYYGELRRMVDRGVTQLSIVGGPLR